MGEAVDWCPRFGSRAAVSGFVGTAIVVVGSSPGAGQ